MSSVIGSNSKTLVQSRHNSEDILILNPLFNFLYRPDGTEKADSLSPGNQLPGYFQMSLRDK